jgi:hypothetical protein
LQLSSLRNVSFSHSVLFTFAGFHRVSSPISQCGSGNASIVRGSKFFSCSFAFLLGKYRLQKISFIHAKSFLSPQFTAPLHPVGVSGPQFLTQDWLN